MAAESWSDAVVPVPLSEAVWGEPLSALETVRMPVLVPDAVGVKITLIEQLAPAAKVEPQLVDCPKSPDTLIDEIVVAAPPVLDKVRVCCGLVVPTI